MDIAGATSEEINNAAAVGNSLLYYASPIPRIDENVARMLALMERGGGIGTAQPTGTPFTPVDYTDILMTANQHLSSLPRMERHLAEIHTMLERVVATSGGKHGINTFLLK